MTHKRINVWVSRKPSRAGFRKGIHLEELIGEALDRMDIRHTDARVFNVILRDEELHAYMVCMHVRFEEDLISVAVESAYPVPRLTDQQKRDLDNQHYAGTPSVHRAKT